MLRRCARALARVGLSQIRGQPGSIHLVSPLSLGSRVGGANGDIVVAALERACGRAGGVDAV